MNNLLRGGSRISRRGAWTYFGGGLGPPMRVLSSENVCENERIGSRGGGGGRGVRRKILYVDPPMLLDPITSLEYV